MNDVPKFPNPQEPLSPWFTREHEVSRCDGSSGHAVATVAFCDTPARAKFLAHAANLHVDLVKALRSVEGTSLVSDEARAQISAVLSKVDNKILNG